MVLNQRTLCTVEENCDPGRSKYFIKVSVKPIFFLTSCVPLESYVNSLSLKNPLYKMEVTVSTSNDCCGICSAENLATRFNRHNLKDSFLGKQILNLQSSLTLLLTSCANSYLCSPPPFICDLFFMQNANICRLKTSYHNN